MNSFTRIIFILSINLSFINFSHALSAYTGNEILKYCKYIDENGLDYAQLAKPENERDYLNSLMCLSTINSIEDGLIEGSIIGYSSAMKFYGANEKQIKENIDYIVNTFPRILSYCTPAGINRDELIEQRIKIIIKYIKEHPEKSHLPLSVLFVNSMQNAFPCNE